MSARTVIRDNLEDPGISFVFPSEVTARLQCRSALAASTRRTLTLNRFLSWDQFKESCFQHPENRTAVNRSVRLLFLSRLLERNSRRAFLRHLIPARYAGNYLVFLPSLQRLLPALNRVPALQARWPAFSSGKLDDLRLLYTEYSSFLAAARLYEPGYEHPLFRPAAARYLLFYPEIIEDFGEFESLLAADPRLQCVSVPPSPRPGVGIQVFDTIIEEVRWTLLAVAELLDRGTDPQDIVLTVGELSVLETLLRREAELYEVPLAIHQGRALCEFPLIRALGRIRSAVDCSFDLPTMKALLLDRALPWKQEGLCRGLIRVGLDSRLLRNQTGGGGDSWRLAVEATRRAGNPRGLPLSRIKGFYSSLRHQLQRIIQARSFAELKSDLVDFAASFLDLKRLAEEELRIFQFAVDTLDALDWAEQVAPPPSEAVFSLWWNYLASSVYVPGQKGGGVAVYPYRVSAGITPEHHFLVNCSQAATGHRIRRYPFLSIHEEEHFAETQKELSADYLRLYSHCGSQVRFSYSRRDTRGANLPPAFFAAQGFAPQAAGTPPAPDSYSLEREAWVGGGSFPLLPVQSSGYLSASVSALKRRELDATRSPLADRRLICTLEDRLKDEQGTLGISTTALERFSLCPFHFLLERLLDVESEDFEVVLSDPREFGIIMHRVLQRFFAAGEDEGGLLHLHPEKKVEYRDRMKRTVAEVCSAYRRKNPVLLRPLWSQLERRAEELALAFLDTDLEMMGEEQTEATEIKLQSLVVEAGIVLVGKIDRICRNPGGYTVVDYKKKKVPAAAEIFSPDPVSLQMPCYIYLMESTGRSVSRAAFYSIENRRYRFLFGGPESNMAEAGAMRLSVEKMKERIREMGDRIARGDFRIRDPYRGECSRCPLAEVCRRRYLLDP
jgi:RecB family exonuclease